MILASKIIGPKIGCDHRQRTHLDMSSRFGAAGSRWRTRDLDPADGLFSDRMLNPPISSWIIPFIFWTLFHNPKEV